MEIKTLDDILKLRDEFSKNFERRMKTLERPGAGGVDLLLEEKHALVKESKARMAAAEKAKAAMAKRIDDELARHKQTVERLEREIDELTKAGKGGATGGGGDRPQRTGRPGRKRTE